MPDQEPMPLLEKFEVQRTTRNPKHLSVRLPESLIKKYPAVLGRGNEATVTFAESDDSLTVAYRFDLSPVETTS